MHSFKQKTIKGLMWSSIERLSVQGVQFFIQILMARLLLPSDFGVIAMLAIFIALAQTFVESGFSSALVQKKDRSEHDYSTVFYFNIGISLFFYFLLFFSSKWIAQFYDMPTLVPITKIIALNLLISAFAIVPRAKFTVLLDFKTQTIAALIGVVLSGIIGVWMAYSGYGVWALVVQSLLNNAISTLLLWIFARWAPLFFFSKKSFQQLFAFGSKLLLSALLETLYRNLYTLVIGKKFSAKELGYYSRADQISQFPSLTISSIVMRVAFPIMSEIQQDDAQLKTTFSKFLKMSVYIVFPLMIGLAALAEPLVRLVLTEKWLDAVLLLQVLCFMYLFYPLHSLNLCILQAKGRSDLFLKLEILKKISGVGILIITIPMGILEMCIGLVFSSILSLYINSYYTKKIMNITFISQIKDIFPSFLLSLTMGCGLFLITQLGFSDIQTIIIGFTFGILYFFGMSQLIHIKEWEELRSYIIRYYRKTR